jgi:hypothetical protein
MRRAVLLALPVLAGAALAAFGPTGQAPAAEPDVTHVDRDLGYRCEFPSGAQPVDVGVTADVPASGSVGRPVVPSAAAVTLSVGQPALADLTGMGATSVGAVVRMDLTVTQGETAATTTWSGVRTDTTPIPADAALALDVPLEPPPPLVVAAPGDVVIAAAGLTVTLTGYTADGVVTEPPTVDLACTLAPDQAADLAVVAMSDVDEPAPGAGEPAPPGSVVVGPGTAATPPPSAKAVEIPADCEEIDPPKPANSRYCAYVTGYANVAKLNASVLQPPGIVNIGPTNFSPLTCDPPTPPILCQQANLLANEDGRPVMPEVSSSLLPFGFVPTTAKLQLTQIGLGFADVRLHPTNSAFSSATVTGTYVARLYDATVNGVPLDLGPNCRTATPIDVDVFGKPPTYLLTGGGPLSGMVTIPPFTGCGVTEDLDPLITGLVSGPGNFVKLTQGPICTINGNNFGCPPHVPTPQT